MLLRGFQVNRENLMRALAALQRTLRLVPAVRRESVVRTLGIRDWRDLQLLSQLAWMDEEYLATDQEVSRAFE